MANQKQGRIIKAGSRAGERLNTVGMTKRELDSMLCSWDVIQSSATNRVFTRWRYHSPSVKMLLKHTSGADLSIHVACRNLSCGGASVLHNAYVHTETPCTLMLPRRSGSLKSIVGTVLRCEHRQGVVHELGIRFNQPIRVRDYCGTGPLLDQYSFERVDPSRLAGTALIVSDSELQHRALERVLGKTQIRSRLARTCDAALEENLGSIDVVIADWILPDGEGHSLLTTIRSYGCTAPVILAIPEGMDVSAQRDGIAPEAYLRLPIKPDDVFRAMAEFLLMPKGSESTARGSGDQTNNLAVILQEAIDSLTIGMSANDGIGCYSVCVNLRELAEKTSLGQVASLATQAANALGASLDLNAARVQIDALLVACKGIVSEAAAA